MTAARPLALDDDFDVQPLTAEMLATLHPEERALAEEALGRVANGTTRGVPHAEVVAAIERQRPAARG